MFTAGPHRHLDRVQAREGAAPLRAASAPVRVRAVLRRLIHLHHSVRTGRPLGGGPFSCARARPVRRPGCRPRPRPRGASRRCRAPMTVQPAADQRAASSLLRASMTTRLRTTAPSASGSASRNSAHSVSSSTHVRALERSSARLSANDSVGNMRRAVSPAAGSNTVAWAPRRCSAAATLSAGESRTSSVSGLKAAPSTPTRALSTDPPHASMRELRRPAGAAPC